MTVRQRSPDYIIELDLNVLGLLSRDWLLFAICACQYDKETMLKPKGERGLPRKRFLTSADARKKLDSVSAALVDASGRLEIVYSGMFGAIPNHVTKPLRHSADLTVQAIAAINKTLSCAREATDNPSNEVLEALELAYDDAIGFVNRAADHITKVVPGIVNSDDGVLNNRYTFELSKVLSDAFVCKAELLNPVNWLDEHILEPLSILSVLCYPDDETNNKQELPAGNLSEQEYPTPNSDDTETSKTKTQQALSPDSALGQTPGITAAFEGALNRELIASALKKARSDLGLTQRAAASTAGVNLSDITRIEGGTATIDKGVEVLGALGYELQSHLVPIEK